LACGFPELGALSTVICRKTPHFCKDTKMATPLEFCRGIVTASKLVLFNTKTCEYMSWDMWRTCEHVSRLCELVFALDLSQSSFHSVAVGFAILCSQRCTLVNIHASTVAFIEIWANCACLFYMLTNTTLNRLGLGMLIVGTAIFRLHLLISSSRERYM